jgi:dihydroxy-acid dehydratase
LDSHTIKRSAARDFLRAVNWHDADFQKPIIGVCCPISSSYSPCNAHFDKLGDYIEREIELYGGRAIIFSTPTINDGMTMGTEGMRYSLPSRELIADSIETMYEGYHCDALITVGGCDKTQPVCIQLVVDILRMNIGRTHDVYSASASTHTNSHPVACSIALRERCLDHMC